MHGERDIDVEEGTVKPVDSGQLGRGVDADLLVDRKGRRIVRDLVRGLDIAFRRGRAALVDVVRGVIATATAAAAAALSAATTGAVDGLREAEDGFPPARRADRVGGGIPEARGGEGALGPARVQARKVPLDELGRRVPVELVAHIDQTLDRRHIDFVYRREVKDHCS